jgi:hypothetical protein
MSAGLLVAVGCGQKPLDRTPGKVTSEDVRRDAGQAVNTAAEYSQQTKEEFRKNFQDKIKNRNFLRDTEGLLRPGITYDPQEAYRLVENRLVNFT